jgi:transposase
LFLEAVLWMARSGARSRDLHDRFGKVDTIKRRYRDWIERGVFLSRFHALSEDVDFDWLMIDSTIVRAHQHAAGARGKMGGITHPTRRHRYLAAMTPV